MRGRSVARGPSCGWSRASVRRFEASRRRSSDQDDPQAETEKTTPTRRRCSLRATRPLPPTYTEATARPTTPATPPSRGRRRTSAGTRRPSLPASAPSLPRCARPHRQETLPRSQPSTTAAGDALWMTDMGFSATALAAIDEVLRADDWGLSSAAFDLPPAGDLPGSRSTPPRRTRSSSISPS